jgi:catechol 2,3-dioxygenase-like lactoylglutathione lyase family enzyme
MTRALEPQNLYHTGIVVPDLDAAAQRFTAMAGYSFTTPIAGPVTIRTPTGQRTVDLRFVYSLQAPHVELIEEVPDTPWIAARGNAVHHLGYFTDDFTTTASALQADGFSLELCPASDDDAPSIFAYYLSPEGIRVEIVDRTVFGDLDAFLKAFQ